MTLPCCTLPRRKYYDDCSQILSEHILASVKPAALKTFSTLNPLVTTSLNRQSAADLAAAARKLNAALSRSRQSSSSSIGDTSELLNSAAATLVEGAVPVREFPANLTSEPASIAASGSSSVADVTLRADAMSADTHEEELRCVIAIIRHGDRCVYTSNDALDHDCWKQTAGVFHNKNWGRSHVVSFRCLFVSSHRLNFMAVPPNKN